MTKVLFVAKKRQDLTDDAFISYWQQVHAPLVARIPGVRRYVINAVIPDDSLTKSVCDGIAEVWFDSRAALQDGVASAAGQAAVADIPNFCSPASGTVVAEEIDSPISRGR
ncbi:MAG TPA: EthD family reductase [Vicinamibacterales bacterium]|nr:EthD family reductase [Vicinamibacterales bacterium]